MTSLRQLFLRHVAQTSPSPLGLEISHAEGVYQIGTDGKRYIDLIAGISVSNLGHCHPAVVQAVTEQTTRHMHLMVYGETVQATQVQFAEAICGLLPDVLDSVYFVNSGSEATEGALKLAVRATGRTQFATLRNAYHGSTLGALGMMGHDMLRAPYTPLLPDTLRLDPNIAEQLDQVNRRTAAIFIEAVQGEAGARPLTADYLRAVRRRCDNTGTLMVVDEIQSGFGRTGSMFAFMDAGVVPDMVLMAKGMGAGMPIGALVARKELMSLFTHDPVLGHITTFGGHPVSCAAGLAGLRVVQSGGLMERATVLESIFRQRLIHPKIKEIRGRGALLALELGDAALVQSVIARCLERGVITDWFLFCDTALRIAPPLIMTDEEAHTACDIVLGAL
jgi:acetylornithine/N-succinyldiaminopimelate aminotransferase